MSKLNVGVLGLSHDHVWGNLGALATGELGRVIARTLAGCGARLAIHYHRAAERAAALQRELPGSASFQADITVKADVDRMRDAVKAQLGAPDIEP